jgi:replication-associated recombination protein RarA
MTEQFEDQWSRSITVNGLRADEVRSVLQKSIRRGLVEPAVKAAYELFASGPEAEDMLWSRLEIIAVEDVGAGIPHGPQLLEALNSQRLRRQRDLDRFMFSAHAVRLLAEAPKDRTTMELAVWVQSEVEAGRAVEVLDFHVDHHTRRGVGLGRDPRFWWQAGGYGLENQVDPAGSNWTGYVRAVLGAPVDDPAPAPDYARRAPQDAVAARLLAGE